MAEGFDAGTARGKIVLDASGHHAAIEMSIKDINNLVAIQKGQAALAKRIAKETASAQIKSAKESVAAQKIATKQQSSAIKAHIADLNTLVKYEKQARQQQITAFWGSGLSAQAKIGAAGMRNLKKEIVATAANAAQASSVFYKLGNAFQVYGSFAGKGLSERIAQFAALRSAAVAAAHAQDLLLAKQAGFTAAEVSGRGPGRTEAAAIAAVTARYSTYIKVAGAATLATAGVGAAMLTAASAAKPFIKAEMDLENSFAGVEKTVDGTTQQLAKLRNELLGMSTKIPVSVHALNGVAESAGQLGVARQDIIKFTETMARMGVATNLASEEAATALASWKNITRTPMSEIDRLASTVSKLGNETNSTEKQIVEFGVRIAGAGKIIGLTDANIAAISASLASVGLEAESAGTAYSRLFYRLYDAAKSGGSALRLVSSVAGVTADEFQRLAKTDPAKMVESFISGLGRYIEAGGNFVEITNAMGMKEVRLRDALARSATAYRDLSKNIKSANDEYKTNTQLVDEAQKRFQTTANKIVVLQNAWNKLKTDIGSTEFFRQMIDTATKAISAVDDLAVSLSDFSMILYNISKVAITTPFPGMSAAFLLKAYSDGDMSVEKALEKSSERRKEILRSEMEASKDLVSVSWRNIESSIVSALSKINGKTKVEVKSLAEEIKDFVNSGEKSASTLSTLGRIATGVIPIYGSLAASVKIAANSFDFLTESEKKARAEIEKAIAFEKWITEIDKAIKRMDAIVLEEEEFVSKLEERGEEWLRKLIPDDAIQQEFEKAWGEILALPEWDTAVAESFGKYLVEKYKDIPDVVERAMVSIGNFRDELIAGSPHYEMVSALILSMADAYGNLQASLEAIESKRTKGSLLGISEDDIPAWKNAMNEFENAVPKIEQVKQGIQDIIDAGRMDEGTMNIIAPGIWQKMSGLSTQEIADIKKQVDALGQSISKIFANAQPDKKQRGKWGSEVLQSIYQLGGAIGGLGGKFTKWAKVVEAAAQLAALRMALVASSIDPVSAAIQAATIAMSFFGSEGEKELKGMAKVIDEIKEASEQWIEELTDKFLEFIKTGKFALDEFLTYISDEIAQIATEELVIRPIVQFVGSMIGKSGKTIADTNYIESGANLSAMKSGGAYAKALGGVTVNVNDYRSSGSPVQVVESTGINGRQIDVIIRDSMKRVMSEGCLDSIMNKRLRLSARGV